MVDEIEAKATAATAPAALHKTAQPPSLADEKNAKVASEALAPAAKKAETQNFQASHHLLRWHVDILVDGHDVYQGYIKEITVDGTHLFLDHNLQNSKFVKLHIHVPPIANAAPPRIIEVTGKILSSVHDNDEDTFRSGIHFQKFTLESDRTFLLSVMYD